MKLDVKTVESFNFYMKRYRGLYRDLALSIDRLVSKTTTSNIVDLGAGPGLLVRELQDILPFVRVIALDPSILMLKSAEENIIRKGYLVLSRGEYIPLCDSSVDIVVSRFTLPYWSDTSKVLGEIYRIVKPNGKIVIDALNASYPSWKLFFIKINMLFKRTPKSVIDYHIDAYKNAYTVEQLKDKLMDHGFKIMDIIDRGWFYRITAEKPKVF